MMFDNSASLVREGKESGEEREEEMIVAGYAVRDYFVSSMMMVKIDGLWDGIGCMYGCIRGQIEMEMDIDPDRGMRCDVEFETMDRHSTRERRGGWSRNEFRVERQSPLGSK